MSRPNENLECGRRQFLKIAGATLATVSVLGVTAGANASRISVPAATELLNLKADKNGNTPNFTLNLRRGDRFRVEFSGRGIVRIRRWKRYRWRPNKWKTDYEVKSGDVLTAKMDHTGQTNRMRCFELPPDTRIRFFKVS